MRTIVFFDFDGTITNQDSLIEFLLFAINRTSFVIGIFFLLPTLLLYKLKLVPNYVAKEKIFIQFFKDKDEKKFKKLAYDYSTTQIDNILRNKAIEKLNWHKTQGHKIVIVSASIDCWLRPWCEKNDFELIATKLEFKNEKVTGKFFTKNCYGIEKVNRIKEIYNLSAYDCIYAYGDSKGDKEMFSIADKTFYKPFEA